MPQGANLYDEARLQGRLWTPKLMRGQAWLNGWYDASDTGTLTVSGSNVSAWADKSGFNRTLTGVNSPTYADFTVSVTNAGTQQFTVTAPANTFLVFAVGTPLAAGNARTLIQVGTNMRPWTLNTGTNNMGVFVTATFTQGGSLTWPNQFGQGLMQISTTTSFPMGRDGGTLVAAVPSAMTLSTSVIVMNAAAGAQGWGSINELIFAPSGSVSLFVQQKIEGYFAWKWLHTRGALGNLVNLLPASHPYKKRPPLI